MTKLIALYNHKGGVSKTTTTFNLGWALANLGLRVGIADLDPQCNLTAMVLGLSHFEDFSDFYERKKNDDIYQKIEPILITGQDTKIEPVRPCATDNDHLFLIAGHPNIADIDKALILGLMSDSANVSFATQFVGALNHILRESARRESLDIVLIDMSPSVDAMNRILLMSSDYFIIPTSPDFFCYQIIQSLPQKILKWERELRPFRNPKIRNSLEPDPPKFLGIISQKYNVYAKKMAKSYEHWKQKIQEASRLQVAHALQERNMVIDERFFRELITHDAPYNLINVPDFNSLVGLSQKHSKPVFNLTEEDIDKKGQVKENLIASRDLFKTLFYQFAKDVCGLVQLSDRMKKGVF